MSKLQPVRGTHDIYGQQAISFDAIYTIFKEIAERYGHHKIDTPIFEFTEIFKRTLGESSDVVSKEMYVFEDRGGEELTLRPEYTASIARSFISNGMQQSTPCKFYAFGPLFRYERPQKGRMRQFHQLDIEILGVPNLQADIEVLAIADTFLDAIGVKDDVTLELNSLADPESRANYRTALVDYFSAHKNTLSEDSLKRLDKNPLRILDSKDEGDKSLVVNAPRLKDYYNEYSRDFFNDLKLNLNDLGIHYQINERLVRGLDYYNHTTFEFITDKLGAQGTVLAGGRYDGLIKQMGGSDAAGIGWAAGMERLAELVSDKINPTPQRPISLIPMGDQPQRALVKVAYELRKAGYTVDMNYKGNVGKRMKRANQLNASHAIIIGEDELHANKAQLKDLDQGQQSEIAIDQIVKYFAAQ